MCITTGPLKKFEGYIRTVDRHRRVAKLEVPILGRPTPKEVGSGQIKVLKGIFKGMTGKFLHADVGQNKWTVELELFGVETKVSFRREEIKI